MPVIFYMANEPQTLNTRYLYRDIDKYLRSYAYGFAKAAAEDMTSAAEKYIKQFYVDYAPIQYNRTFNFRDGSYEKILRQYEDKSIGGVWLTHLNMSVYQKYRGLGKGYDEIPPEVIWEQSLQGWHGNPKNPHWTPPRMSPSPIELINQYYKQNCNLSNKKYKNAARKYAESQHYSTFGF